MARHLPDSKLWDGPIWSRMKAQTMEWISDVNEGQEISESVMSAPRGTDSRLERELTLQMRTVKHIRSVLHRSSRSLAVLSVANPAVVITVVAAQGSVVNPHETSLFVNGSTSGFLENAPAAASAIPQPRGRTGSNAVEAWRWQHCSGEGKFVMSVFDRREARIQEFGDTTAAGLCREADWNFGGPTVGKAEGRITVIGRMG